MVAKGSIQYYHKEAFCQTREQKKQIFQEAWNYKL